ncbi:MAG: hypothetical protein LC790_04040, partial [Actinobacteria bacterium]|nr:hypothetical protein [Actinomycetota bacterium]MCA1698103.1 hypothetical protein [Actinomycetota bacterium]
RWIVDVKPGSVKLPLRPAPAQDDVAPSAMPEVVAAITKGIALLDRTAERPDYFSDKALTSEPHTAERWDVAVRRDGYEPRSG